MTKKLNKKISFDEDIADLIEIDYSIEDKIINCIPTTPCNPFSCGPLKCMPKGPICTPDPKPGCFPACPPSCIPNCMPFSTPVCLPS